MGQARPLRLGLFIDGCERGSMQWFIHKSLAVLLLVVFFEG